MPEPATPVSTAYYRCYLIDRRGHFGVMRDGLFAGDQEATAFATEELQKARLTANYIGVEVSCGRRKVTLVNA